MFTLGPFDIRLRLDSATYGSGVTSVSSSMTDVNVVVELLNRSVFPQDVEVEISFANCLLECSPGVYVFARARTLIPAVLAWASAYRIVEGVSRASGNGTGSDTVACIQARYRQSGRPSWSGWRSPASGHTYVVSAT